MGILCVEEIKHCMLTFVWDLGNQTETLIY